MKIEDLPKPLQGWLMEREGYHIRIERLYEEHRSDPPARMLDWLNVAYELGREHERALREKAPLVQETQAGEVWQPWDARKSASLAQSDSGFVMQVEGQVFGPTLSHNALGLLCFAYGLDNALFSGVSPDKDMHRWLVWHFAALLCKPAHDFDLPAALVRALTGARDLASDDSIWLDVLHRIELRFEAMAQQRGWEPQGAQVLREWLAYSKG
jgi:hypothetical protein